MRLFLKAATALLFSGASCLAFGQKYPDGIVDKTIAVVGNEMITISQLEEEVQMMIAQGYPSERCELLENMMVSKLFLMQARLDSLEVNNDIVEGELRNRIDQFRTYFGGDEGVEKQFGKPMYKLRQEWRQAFQDQSLTQTMQQNIMADIPEVTPHDVKEYLKETDPEDLPMVPIKYQLSQICIYPDREAANTAVKERLLAIRERIINGEKFSTLARIYSQDPGSSRKGGELGMASKSIFWPAFSDAAMALKPGVVSQIVETPDGFHIIEVLEKKGDMFNARHILLKPEYTAADQEKAFHVLDSLKTAMANGAVTFDMAARFYSEDPATRTNGGQMADPSTGSSYFEIDQLKPQDYQAIKDLKEGEISDPVESLDNEGRSGNTVYKIIKVDKILPAHTASFENDYNLLSEQVRQEASMKAVDDFVNSKLKTTYIIIDPLFKDCDFQRDGWYDKIREREQITVDE
ncbi:MAG: peptidylprolyl isomerase [Bacteroidetes bacterium]|uniref:peptidylprolyl isomerase n=1 Tax=Candidatus Cryptobacteroides excrementipullorum TaxID=2840761 RepID=A0A9D9NLY0_9BACT|nr:peptidylprolyl isomerase [Candidatus Cryptobacteroides excrementipullorum]